MKLDYKVKLGQNTSTSSKCVRLADGSQFNLPSEEICSVTRTIFVLSTCGIPGWCIGKSDLRNGSSQDFQQVARTCLLIIKRFSFCEGNSSAVELKDALSFCLTWFQQGPTGINGVLYELW